MDNNTPYDKSGYPPPRQGTYHKRIDAFITRIEDRITLLLEGISIDELSAYERFQLAAKSDGLLLRLLPLLEKVEADEIERDNKSSNGYPMYSSIGELKLIPGQVDPKLVANLDDDKD